MTALFPLHRPLGILTLLSSGLLGGCAALSDSAVEQISRLVTPYKIEIVQGNVVTREQLALIGPGKSRTDVRDALGAPLLADAFHVQRWDYAFALRRNGSEVQRRTVTVLFEGDVVKSIEAPELPSERDFVRSIKKTTPAASDLPPPKLSLTEQERAALPPPPPPPARPSTPLGANRPYPPLESL